MKRLMFVIAVLFIFTGCPQKDPTDQERLAQQQAELKEIRSRKELANYRHCSRLLEPAGAGCRHDPRLQGQGGCE